jgi:hypothetical protein
LEILLPINQAAQDLAMNVETNNSVEESVQGSHGASQVLLTTKTESALRKRRLVSLRQRPPPTQSALPQQQMRK